MRVKCHLEVLLYGSLNGEGLVDMLNGEAHKMGSPVMRGQVSGSSDCGAVLATLNGQKGVGRGVLL